MNNLRLISSNAPTVITQKKPGEQKSTSADLRKYYPRQRARLNIIPTDQQLENLVKRALEALSKGIFWDRGSIINIVL